MIEQRVTLRYGAQQIPAIVQAVQGDTGRDVIFELADYEIPAGATANYYIDKPDGNAIYNSAEVISSTEILAHMTEQALAAPGRNNGQVRILIGGEVITSFDFVLEVEAFRGILHMQSETEVNIFDAAIQSAADEAIEEIQEQTPVVTGMQNSIAPTYSSSNTYAVGDYVMYNAQLYRCITAITTAEAWTAAHWTQVPIASDVSDLKGATSGFFAFGNEFTLNKTATVTPDASFNWPVYIPKGCYVFFTNNSADSMTLNVYDPDGTQKNITSSIAPNGTKEFITPFDIVKIRNYIGVNGSAFSVSLRIINIDKERVSASVNGNDISSVGSTNLYVKNGEKILIDVLSNTIATNLYVRPSQSGEPYITIATGAGKYEFTATKDGFIQLQNTGTIISAKMYLNTRFDSTDKEIKAEIEPYSMLPKTIFSLGDSSNFVKTASVRPDTTYSWDTYIPKDTIVTFTNNTSVPVTFRIVDKNGNVETISSSVGAGGDSKKFVSTYDIYGIKNYVGNTNTVSFSVEMTNAETIRKNSILYGFIIDSVGIKNLYLKQGEKIKIIVRTNTIATNLFIDPSLEGEPYTTLNTGAGEYEFTAIKSGFIKLQGTATAIDATIFLYSNIEIPSQNEPGTVYTVKKDGTGDYSTFVECLKALENNTTQKTIQVYPGVYDIYDELGGDEFIESITNPESTNWRTVNPVVPPNTKVIGMGNVELRFAPTASQIGSNQMAYLFSPLNVSGSCEIENISIYGTNCRYAIHDESSGLSAFDDSTHIYRNVRVRKEHGTYGNDQVFGSGIGSRSHWAFESCEFTSDRSAIWTTHTNPSNANDLAEITFDSCIFKVDSSDNASEIVQFIVGASNNAALKNIVRFNSCYVAGSVSVYTNESSNTVTNKFALTSLKTTMSGGILISENFSSNPYTPKVFN